MMNQQISILIVDDHPIFRKGLRQVIEADSMLNVIGEAGDGITALQMIERDVPDVVVADIHMPQMGGFDLARAVKNKGISVALAFLTMYKDEDIFNTAMDLGVRGYVLKDSAITDITGCIRAVAAGHPYITPELSHFLLNRSNRAASLLQLMPSLHDLTPTERRVLKLIADY